MGTCDVTFCDNDAVLHQKRFYQKIVQKLLQHESIGKKSTKRNLFGQQLQKENLKPSKSSL